jgi:PAS domain S-box-containing protein
VSPPPSAFLADVYRYLPFLVIHTTTDGTVLHCNPETLRTTGYEEAELIGRNLWAVLFPGKLFAQVPKFISLVQPAALLRDVPMTIKTKLGDERVIAFTRHMHGGAGGGTGADVSDTAGGARSFICIGVDLTDRLLDADRAQLPEQEFMAPELASENAGSESSGGVVPFGPHIGNAGTVDGEVVTPIAISPRSPRGAGGTGVGGAGSNGSVDQVREGLAKVETHMSSVRAAAMEGEIHVVKTVTEALKQRRSEMSALQFIVRGEWLLPELQGKAMGGIRARVDELLTLYRPEMG